MFTLPVLEGLLALVITVNAVLAWGPFAGADFTVLLVVLEGLDKAENLIDVTADWEIVELLVTENTLAINDEGCSKVKSIIGSQASVVTSELLGQVSKHGNLHTAEASLTAGLLGKLSMSKVRID